jgi:hypothetical protein
VWRITLKSDAASVLRVVGRHTGPQNEGPAASAFQD